MRKRSVRPRIFIGSSSEGRRIAYAIQQNLDDDADVTVWDQNVFRLTKSTLVSLTARLKETDVAIFVFSDDDIVRLRGKEFSSVRDNVIFELGLFMGKLGEDHTFVVVPKNAKAMRIPSDLLGITTGRFNPNRSDGNLRAALGPFCQEVRDHLVIKPPQTAQAKKRRTRRGEQDARLVVIGALYGLRDHRINVARKLNNLVKGDQLHAYVGNQLGGDPCPNSRKDLIVEYMWQGARRTVVVQEGDDLNLPLPEPSPDSSAESQHIPEPGTLRAMINARSRDQIIATLVHTGGNASSAAKILGLSRVTFHKMLQRLGIDSRHYHRSRL